MWAVGEWEMLPTAVPPASSATSWMDDPTATVGAVCVGAVTGGMLNTTAVDDYSHFFRRHNKHNRRGGKKGAVLVMGGPMATTKETEKGAS